jgi:murein DD-endopeptidase MepM/ murein hydrolase activator NlpD
LYLNNISRKTSKKHILVGISCLSFLTLLLSLLGFYLKQNENPYNKTYIHKKWNVKSNKMIYEYQNDVLNDLNLSENDNTGGKLYYATKNPPLKSILYKVESGENLHSIAGKFGLDAATISAINNFSNVHFIREGTKIKIPNQNGIMINYQTPEQLEKYLTDYELELEEVKWVNNTTEFEKNTRLFLPGVRYKGMNRAILLGEAFSRPVRGYFSSGFGYRIDPFTKKWAYHTGVDIKGHIGRKIKAAAAGKVISVTNRWPLGKAIIIRHARGYTTMYAHLSKIYIKRGQYVSRGQSIGALGNTGRSTGPHLHFEIRRYNKPINPFIITVF